MASIKINDLPGAEALDELSEDELAQVSGGTGSLTLSQSSQLQIQPLPMPGATGFGGIAFVRG